MNILSTIPKSRYNSWLECFYDLNESDGSDEGGFWLINVQALPTKTKVGDFCYMIYDGYIRGYFSIVDMKWTEDCRSFHRIGKKRNTYSLVMCNWHSLTLPMEAKGFQGYRYTQLSPLTND